MLKTEGYRIQGNWKDHLSVRHCRKETMHLKIFPLPDRCWTDPASKEIVSPGWCQLWTQDPSPTLLGRLFPGKFCRENSPKLKLVYWLRALIKLEKFLKITSQKPNHKKELPSSPVIERCNVKQIVIKGDRHNESHRSSSLEMIGISVVRGKHHKYWTKCDYKHLDIRIIIFLPRIAGWKNQGFVRGPALKGFHEWIRIFQKFLHTFETWPTLKFSSWFSWYFCPTRLTWEYLNLEYSEFSCVV